MWVCTFSKPQKAWFLTVCVHWGRASGAVCVFPVYSSGSWALRAARSSEMLNFTQISKSAECQPVAMISRQVVVSVTGVYAQVSAGLSA